MPRRPGIRKHGPRPALGFHRRMALAQAVAPVQKKERGWLAKIIHRFARRIVFGRA